MYSFFYNIANDYAVSGPDYDAATAIRKRIAIKQRMVWTQNRNLQAVALTTTALVPPALVRNAHSSRAECLAKAAIAHKASIAVMVIVIHVVALAVRLQMSVLCKVQP